VTEAPAHLAIGEVLQLLQSDFPDVTISKIRFLESQGLINPERTKSGYRKFYDDDIRRLRWVLTQQKERFLPLKVIKAKLDAGEDRDDVQPSLFGEADPPPPPLLSGGSDTSVVADGAHRNGAGVVEAPAAPTPPAMSPPERQSSSADAQAGVSGRSATEESPTRAAGASGRHPAAGRTAATEPASDPAAWLAKLQEGPRRPPASRPVERPLDLGENLSDTTFGRDELLAETGLDAASLDQLVDFGLIPRRSVAGEVTFDESAVAVARAAAVFISRGIEARHLRAYKLAADREVTLFEQLTLPLLRQRNPSSRQQAADQLAELAGFGAELRLALLRQALGPHVRPR